jgi:hypothetical protein
VSASDKAERIPVKLASTARIQMQQKQQWIARSLPAPLP